MTPPTLRIIWTSLAWLAVTLLASWAFMLAWWALLSPSARASDTLEIVIPEGTAAAVAAGQPAPFIPTSLSVPRGGTLRVVNNDTAAHDVGGSRVPPGTTATFDATVGDDGQLTCTIHPSGYLALDLTERPPILSTLMPTLLLGIPAGIALAVVLAITGMLKPEGEPIAG